ncbi:MAG: O-antigen ligase family protein [Opitutaceae bacterium]
MPTESISSRASVWEWLSAALIVANLSWTTLCLGGYRPETMVVTSALNGLLLAVHLVGRAWAGDGNVRRFHPAGWWLLPFLAYALVNVGWVTPVPWLGWRDWLGWAQMILIFWVVLNDVRATSTRTVVFGGLVAVAGVAVVLAAYQRFLNPAWLMLGRTQADQFIGRSSGSFGIPNSLAALLLLLIPALGWLTLRRGATAVQRILGGYLTLVLAFGLMLTISRGAWLALGLVLAAWPVFAARGSWRRRIGLTALAGLGVLVIASALYISLPKVRERFLILKADAGEKTRPIMWRGAWRIFLEHPVMGGGAGSFNVLFEKFRPERYQDQPQWAHNDYINTLSDYGAAGFLLFFGAGAGLAWRAGRGPKPPRRDWLDEPAFAGALAAGLVAFGLQLFVDFHFKIPALAMAFAIIAALWVQLAWPAGAAAEPATRARRLRALGSAAAVLAVMGLWVTPFYRGEALRYRARQAINQMAANGVGRDEQRATLQAARVDLARAVAISPGNAQAWSDLSYADSLWSHVEPDRGVELGREAEQAAQRALELSQIVPEFWLRRGVALDLQGRWSDAGGAFAKALALAPASGNVWFYHAFHLGLNPTYTELAEAAAAFCLHLDPGNQQAQILRQRLAKSLRGS